MISRDDKESISTKISVAYPMNLTISIDNDLYGNKYSKKSLSSAK